MNAAAKKSREKSSLRIAVEDILRFLKEAGGKTDYQETIREIGEEELAEEAINQLIHKDMIRRVNGKLELTEKGRLEADRIYDLHATIEKNLSRITGLSPIERHLIAHSIEHLALDKHFILKLIRPPLKRLIEVREDEEVRIIAILDPRPSILSRLFGLGLLPGRKVRIISRSPGLYIVNVSGGLGLVAIDYEVAAKILVVGEHS
jgi:Fe2+ transport system protein FeoA/predicted transcriptional regulator